MSVKEVDSKLSTNQNTETEAKTRGGSVFQLSVLSFSGVSGSVPWIRHVERSQVQLQERHWVRLLGVRSLLEELLMSRTQRRIDNTWWGLWRQESGLVWRKGDSRLTHIWALGDFAESLNLGFLMPRQEAGKGMRSQMCDHQHCLWCKLTFPREKSCHPRVYCLKFAVSALLGRGYADIIAWTAARFYHYILIHISYPPKSPNPCHLSTEDSIGQTLKIRAQESLIMPNPFTNPHIYPTCEIAIDSTLPTTAVSQMV